MPYGIKSTPPGLDVKDVVDKQLGINTKYYTFKQKQFSNFPTTITILDANENSTVTFTHNLGYKPYFQIYCEDTLKNWFHVPGRSPNGSSGIIYDSTNSAITAQIGQVGGYDGDTTLNVYCIIYLEQDIE